MASDWARLRVTVIVEDATTRKVLYALLKQLGFHRRRIAFRVAPRGEGSAERWVLAQYPGEVGRLRAKRHQRGLRLIVVRDGDADGLARKREFDEVLERRGLEPRSDEDPIALLIPTWSVETWVLALAGHEDVDESASMKERFQRASAGRRTDLIRLAARAWRSRRGAHLPSLVDARAELERVAP